MLRRFRDETLAKSILGRIFVRAYYAVSPKLVKHFGSRTWFKRSCKRILDKFVSFLQKQGVQNDPYEDREW